MGGVLSSCGSIAWLAKKLVSLFPKTYKGSITAMYVSGMLVSPFLSSGSAKGVIMAMISGPTGKNLGIKPNTQAAAGMFMAGWIPVGVLGVCFLSGCMSAPTLTGLVDPVYADNFTWVNWFLQALPFLIVTLVGCYAANLILYKPKAGDIVEAAATIAEADVSAPQKLNSKGYARYSTEAYSDLYVQLVNKYTPSAVFVGATVNGRDFAPHFAACLETGCTSDATELIYNPETKDIEFVEPAAGGKIMAVITIPVLRPQVGTIRPGTFKIVPAGKRESFEIIHESIGFDEEKIRTKLL